MVDQNKARHTIRLAAIDAPESRQPYGKESKQHLSDMVLGKEVKVEWRKQDRYGRIVGKLMLLDPPCATCPKTLDAGLAQLEAGLKDAAKQAGAAVTFQRIGSMFCGYFTREPVHNLADAMKSDRERFKKFFHGMLEEGVYLAPSQFEAGFISTAHSEQDILHTVNAARKVLGTF